MKIGVVTSICGRLPYTAYTVAINTLYCKYHGYEFHPVHTEPDGTRHPAWNKIPAALSRLPQYDFLLCMDADAFFFDFGRRIESLVALMGDDFLMFSQNRKSAGVSWVPKNADEALNPNSGVFLVKNCPAALAFLEEWNGLSEALPHHKFKWPVEEAALRERFFRGDGANKGVRVLVGDDYKLLNGNDGIFIRHPMGGSWNPELRAKQKTAFIEQYRPKVVFSSPHSDSAHEDAVKTRSATGTQLERPQAPGVRCQGPRLVVTQP